MSRPASCSSLRHRIEQANELHRQIKHPAVVAISKSAREDIFGTTSMPTYLQTFDTPAATIRLGLLSIGHFYRFLGLDAPG